MTTFSRIECQRNSSHKTTLTSVQTRRSMHLLGQHNQNGPAPFADLLPLLKTFSTTWVEAFKEHVGRFFELLDSCEIASPTAVLVSVVCVVHLRYFCTTGTFTSPQLHCLDVVFIVVIHRFNQFNHFIFECLAI